MSMLQDAFRMTLHQAEETSGEPENITREQVFADAVACLESAFPEMLPEELTPKQAKRFIVRLAKVVREPLPGTGNGSTSNANLFDSEPINPSVLSSIPGKGRLQGLEVDGMKELIAEIYGSKPRGKFTSEAKKAWIEKLVRDKGQYRTA